MCAFERSEKGMEFNMKIIPNTLICPKCKKTYTNHSLASYSSQFAPAAQSFLTNNNPILECENCHIKLIDENLINDFDEMGNYTPKTKILAKDSNYFNLYTEVLNYIKNFLACVDDGKIVITGNIKKEETSIQTNLVVIGKANNKEYELLSATLEDYSLELGGRKNKFEEYRLANMANSIIISIYDYLFVDDTNHYTENDKSKILSELIKL